MFLDLLNSPFGDSFQLQVFSLGFFSKNLSFSWAIWVSWVVLFGVKEASQESKVIQSPSRDSAIPVRPRAPFLPGGLEVFRKQSIVGEGKETK